MLARVMGPENHVRKVTLGVGEDSSEGQRDGGANGVGNCGEEPDSVR